MSFLHEPEPTPAVRAMYDEDRADYGFVMNLSHVWAHQPEAHEGLFDLLRLVGEPFSPRVKGILVTATASTIGDSYCSWAWGWKLAELSGDDELSAAVLTGSDAGLTPAETALADWARRIAASPGSTTQADVEALRTAGWSDAEVFAATAFVALRAAFSMVNGALGAQPDPELAERAPASVGPAITWGRPLGG